MYSECYFSSRGLSTLLGGASGAAVADIKICPQSVICLSDACLGLLGRDFFEFHACKKHILIFFELQIFCLNFRL